jgi:hypothetical protein
MRSGGATINEIRTDQIGTDNSEYFELSGTAGESLNNLTYLVIGDGVGGSGVLEAVVSLAGQTIPASGIFLAAETTFESGAGMAFDGIIPDLASASLLNFENTDNVTHLLVSGFSGALNADLDTDNDGLLDVTPWTAVVDGVAMILESNPPATTEFHYGTALGLPVLGPDGIFVPGHVFRVPSGNGAFRIGAFDPLGTDDSPGSVNVPEPGTSGLLAMGAVALVSAGLLGRLRKRAQDCKFLGTRY